MDLFIFFIEISFNFIDLEDIIQIYFMIPEINLFA